jgi:molybdopterin/thiamine biosynthesis adenylyltransferase
MAGSPPQLSRAELARYSRHLQLEEIGVAGQQRLAAGRVLVVGAGGLGSPAALYLAAAGVGTIGIADFDRVADHNLQRQLLHSDESVGEPKVKSAARRLRTTNPLIKVIEHPEGVNIGNALALFAGYDVIVDGTDNFSARYLNNDAAFFARKPLVFGSVFKFDGQVSVFDPVGGGPCYRCLFPDPAGARLGSGLRRGRRNRRSLRRHRKPAGPRDRKAAHRSRLAAAGPVADLPRTNPEIPIPRAAARSGLPALRQIARHPKTSGPETNRLNSHTHGIR